eukprot:gene15070-16797_t
MNFLLAFHILEILFFSCFYLPQIADSTYQPSNVPSSRPTQQPTSYPSVIPSICPTAQPSTSP